MANVGLYGFLKLDAEGVKKGVNDTKFLLAELQASYATLQKAAMDAINKIEVDPKAARAGLRELSDNIHDLTKELDESERRLSKFFIKVGADPDSIKKTILETKDALYELRHGADNLIEVKIKVSHQEVKEVVDKIREDMAGAQGLFDPILKDFREIGKMKMVDPTIIKDQLADVFSHITDVKENLNTIKDVTIEADASQVKQEFTEANDNLVRLKTSLSHLKSQLGDYSKFGIDVKPFQEQIAVVDDWIGKLKTDLSSVSKIDFKDNMEGFKERISESAEKFAHMKEEASIAKKEITELSKTPIDIGSMEKSFNSIMDKIVDVDVTMEKLGTKGKKEFGEIGDTIKRLSDNISSFSKEVTKSKKLGIDVAPLREQIKEASDAIRRLKTELKDTAKIDFAKDTEKFYEKADLAAGAFSQIKDRVASIKDEMAKFAGTTVDLTGIKQGFAGVTKEIMALGPLMEGVSSRGEKEFIQSANSISKKFSDVGNDIRNLLSEITYYKNLGVNTGDVETKVKKLQDLVADLKTRFTEVSNMTVDTDTEALQKGMREFQDSLSSVKDGLDSVSGRTEQVFKHEARLKRLSAMWRHWSDTLASISAKFLLIQFALNRMSALVVSVFRPAFNAIESFRESIVSMAATITSLQMPKGDEIGEAYIRAKSYAEGLLYTLQKIDENSIATMTDLKVMTDQFVKHGVLLDYMSESAVEAYKNIGNAIAVIAQAYPARATQVAQEARALMQGSTDIRGTLSTMLDKMMGGKLKENLALWKQQGTVIENIGKHLVGFAAASDDVSTLWSSISATMENIRDRILRAGFGPAYKEMIKSLTRMNELLKENEQILVEGLLAGWEATKAVIQSVGASLAPFLPLLKECAYIVHDIALILGYIGVEASPRAWTGIATLFLPFKAAGSVIEGVYHDILNLNSSFDETKNRAKDITTEAKELGKAWKDVFVAQASADFEKSLNMIGVRFDPLKEGIKGMVVEMDKFSETLDRVRDQKRFIPGLSQGFSKFTQEVSTLKQELEDIQLGKTKFESQDALLQALDFITIKFQLLYDEMEKTPEMKLGLDLTGVKKEFEDAVNNVKTAKDKLTEDMKLPETGGLPTDWESTLNGFYSEAKVKSDDWLENEIRNLDTLKVKWMELTEVKMPGTDEPVLTKAQVDEEYQRRTIELNKEMVRSRQDAVNRLKELDNDITEHTKTELDKQIFANEMWGEKMKDTIYDLGDDLKIPMEEIANRLNIIDAAVLNKNKEATREYKKDIIETLTEIKLAIAEAREKTGELDFVQATDESIASLEELKSHYESLTPLINKATDEKKWLENQLAIAKTKQRIAELKGEIIELQSKAELVEIEVRIKGIERREKLFEISEKQAVQETIQAYNELLAAQERVRDGMAAAGDMEAWGQWNDRIGETREKLLELEETAMQVSDNMQKGILDGLKRYYNENQSMYETASDAMYESASHAAETLSTVFNDFRHNELKAWHEYLADFAEMVLQTLERLIAQMLVAKMLGAALGFDFFGGGGKKGGGGGGASPWDDVAKVHTGGYIGNFHRGGMAGLQSDEIPAVLQTGEGVLSRKEMMKLGGETGFEKLRDMIKTETIFNDPEPARTNHLDNGRYYNRINNEGQETNISVPVNVEGGNKKLEVKLRNEIEATVRRVIKEMI